MHSVIVEPSIMLWIDFGLIERQGRQYMRHLEKELIRPIDIEFCPDEFELLMNTVRHSILFYKRKLKLNTLMIKHPKIYEEELQKLYNFYRRLENILDLNGTTIEG